MKCIVCGYKGNTRFEKFVVYARPPDRENRIAFACPSCGSLQTGGESVLFDGCECPWCGNVEESGFNFQTGRKPGSINEKIFNVVCFCGAMGPDASSKLEAVKKFKKWQWPLKLQDHRKMDGEG
jgi:hypothetical protein